MLRTRVIPCLLLLNTGLVKTIRFKAPRYLGDPINIIRIFNDKQVDELVLLDIRATKENKQLQFDYIAKLTSECFMPMCYGGGVRNLDEMKMLFSIGIEKVSLNTYAVENPAFIRAAADLFGSQSVVVSIDVKKSWLGNYEVVTQGGARPTGIDPVKFSAEVEKQGAGEILLNAIDQDGMMQGYDLELIRKVSSAVNIPVIACGGAGKLQDFGEAVKAGAAAAAAGSFFVFQGPHRAVLVSYPTQNELRTMFSE